MEDTINIMIQTPPVETITTPDDVMDLARELMEVHGLDGWRFNWDSAKVRAGCCNYTKKKISLSMYYVAHNLGINPEDIKDTILHEIAHAIAGPGNGHNYKWRAICREIGANPVRCYDPTKVIMPKGDWKAMCPNCERIYYRHRKPSDCRDYWCPLCGGIIGPLKFAHQPSQQQEVIS